MKVIKSVVRVVRLDAKKQQDEALENAFERCMAEINNVNGVYKDTHLAITNTQEAPRAVVMLTYTVDKY